MSGSDFVARLVELLKQLVKPLVGVIILAAIFLLARWFGLFSSPLTSTRIVGVPAKPPEGVLYHLPLTVVDVDVLAKLNGCGVVKIPAGDDGEVSEFAVDFLLQPTIILRTIADPRAVYILDGKNLGAALFSSDVTVDLSGGLVTAVSAESTSLGLQVPASSEFTKLVQGVKGSAIATQVSSKSKAVSELSACGPLIYAQLSRRAELVEQIKAAPAPALLEILRADLAAVDKALSPEARFTLVPRRSEPESLKIRIDPSLLFVGLGANLKEYLQGQAVEIAVTPDESGGAALPAGSQRGLVYRNAAMGKLALCQDNCVVDGSGKLAAAARLYAPPRAIQVAQFGTDAVMPVERNLFSKTSVTLAFTAEGTLSRISTSDKPMPPAGIITAPSK